ncbi:MAG: AbrB/MazE/SpoVT family DNA-binding domain-containing protein [Thermoleophilaceae bacterium]
MSRRVKNARSQRPAGQTRISAKHQVTIPIGAFAAAGLRPGDVFEVEAIGPGRVVLTRQADPLDELSGSLSTGGGLREKVEGLRDEWR